MVKNGWILYLENHLPYGDGWPLILTGICTFYLVFHIMYMLKPNRNGWNWPFLQKMPKLAKSQYLENEWLNRLRSYLILTGKCTFLLVFNIIYILKLNRMAEIGLFFSKKRDKLAKFQNIEKEYPRSYLKMHFLTVFNIMYLLKPQRNGRNWHFLQKNGHISQISIPLPPV